MIHVYAKLNIFKWFVTEHIKVLPKFVIPILTNYSNNNKYADVPFNR